MTVPTPPSTTDFQTIEYSGLMGATEFTLGTITPEGDSYNVEQVQKKWVSNQGRKLYDYNFL